MDTHAVAHLQAVFAITVAATVVAVAIFAIVGRWSGGVWTILLATSAVTYASYEPLIAMPPLARLATDPVQRTLAAAAVLAVLLAIASIRRVPAFVGTVVAVVAPATLLLWVFWRFNPAPFDRSGFILHRIVPAAAMSLVMWLLIEPLAVRLPGTAAATVATALAAGMAALLLLSAEAWSGQMATVTAAAVGGTLLACVVSAATGRPLPISRGPIALWLFLLASLFTFMWVDTDALPVGQLAWVSAAAVTAWLLEIGPPRRWRPWVRAVVRVGIVLLPVAVGVTLAFRQHFREAAESGDPYGMANRAAAVQEL